MHNEILKRDPALLEPLYEGFPYYRSGEQGPGEAPVTPWNVPVFSFLDGKLAARYIREYIDRGAAISGAASTAARSRRSTCSRASPIRATSTWSSCSSPARLCSRTIS